MELARVNLYYTLWHNKHKHGKTYRSLYKITGYNWTSFTLGGVSETCRRGSFGKAFDILKVEVNVNCTWDSPKEIILHK